MKLQLNVSALPMLLLLIVLLLWWLSQPRQPDAPEPESKMLTFPPSVYPYGRTS